jgi:hypothetical protein
MLNARKLIVLIGVDHFLAFILSTQHTAQYHRCGLV